MKRLSGFLMLEQPPVRSSISIPSTSMIATLVALLPGSTMVDLSSEVSETGVISRLPVPQPATNNKRQQQVLAAS